MKLGMVKLGRVVLLSVLLICTGFVHAEIRQYRELPDSVWKTLADASGVRMTGVPGLKANIQVVCDANCPHCAHLDRMLREKHEDLAVRWVPVAYFKPDSEAIAAAILSSQDPAASLEANYRNYDFDVRHGGYPQPSERLRLATGHAQLKRAWKQWGGFTPMVIVRTRDGRILQALGASDAFVESVLKFAAQPIRAYEAWRPASPQGG